jgi:phage regulator Rha-like protein
MTHLINTYQLVVMTSREIAELTNKDHKNVLADIRKMLEELGLMSADFSADMRVAMPRGGFRVETIFNLPKRETLILVSGYDTVLRAKVVDRMNALEAKAVPQVQNPVLQALMAQMVELDRVEQQQKVLAQRLDAIEDRVSTQDSAFYTVLGYSKRVGAFIDNVKASVLGRKATKLSKEREYPMGEASDPRYGKVHTYHVDILQEVFA